MKLPYGYVLIKGEIAVHSSDEKNLLPTPMREAHFNQR